MVFFTDLTAARDHRRRLAFPVPDTSHLGILMDDRQRIARRARRPLGTFFRSLSHTSKRA